jgi:ABC-type nickel/cobalt efflux system permease component RcnA
MRTSIKILLLKSVTFLVGLLMVAFGIGSGAVIFARSTEIVSSMPYTSEEASGILVFIGIILIWLIVLLAESAEWIVREGFKKVEKIN